MLEHLTPTGAALEPNVPTFNINWHRRSLRDRYALVLGLGTFLVQGQKILCNTKENEDFLTYIRVYSNILIQFNLCRVRVPWGQLFLRIRVKKLTFFLSSKNNLHCIPVPTPYVL